MFSCEMVAVEKDLSPECPWEHGLPVVFAAASIRLRSLSMYFSFLFLRKGDKLI